MKIGKLYSYSAAFNRRNLFTDKDDFISFIVEDEWLLLLDYENVLVNHRMQSKRCKVLTSKGIVGWIYVYPSDNIKEVTNRE
jgi:hypothetical protein